MSRHSRWWSVVLGILCLISLKTVAPAQASLQATPTSIDFGNQTAFIPGTGVQVQVKNVGSSNATSITPSTTSTDFTVEFTNCLTLTPTGTCVVSVKPTPQGAGQRNGNLLIKSNAPDLLVPLTMVAVGGVGVSPTSLVFSNTPVGGASAAKTITVGNGTANALSLTVQLSDSTNYQVSGCANTVASGQTCTLSVTFTPKAAGLLTGTIMLSDASQGFSQQITLTGAADTPLTLTPASVVFPDTVVGVKASYSVTVKNNSTFQVQVFLYDRPAQNFNLAPTTNCQALQPGATCSISATFAPVTTGPLSGTLVLFTNPDISPHTNLPVSGNGVAATGTLTVTATPSFQNTTLGQSAQSTLTVQNLGVSPITIKSMNIGGSAPYGVFTAPQNCVVTLAAQASCNATVTFTPLQAVGYSGSISVAFNDNASPLTTALSGTGTTSSTFGFSKVVLPFAAQPLHTTSPPQQATLTNNSGATVTVSNISISGEFTQSNICPATMTNGASCNINISFSPSTSGAKNGTLTVSSSVGQVTLNVSGNGLDQSQVFERPPRTTKPN